MVPLTLQTSQESTDEQHARNVIQIPRFAGDVKQHFQRETGLNPCPLPLSYPDPTVVNSLVPHGHASLKDFSLNGLVATIDDPRYKDDKNVGLIQIRNVEPTPLPPVYTWHGDEILQVDASVSVANHPDFVKLDGDTFIFTHGRVPHGRLRPEHAP
jgi:hypothetical protein